MARYFITFDNGMKAPVSATKVEQNVDGREYRFLDGDGQVVAYVPVINVLSIILTEDVAAKPVID